MRIADRWFDSETVDDGVIRIVEPHVDPFLRGNMHLVRGRERDLLIDTGLGITSLREELDELFERPVVAVATHRHFDHTGGLHEFDEVAVHRDDADSVANADGFASLRIEDYPPEEVGGYDVGESLLTALPHEGFDVDDYRLRSAAPTRILDEGDVVDLGDRRFTVLHLPGQRLERSGCGRKRPARCSRATASTRAANSSTSCRSRTSRITSPACAGCSTCPFGSCTAATTTRSDASASTSSSISTSRSALSRSARALEV